MARISVEEWRKQKEAANTQGASEPSAPASSSSSSSSPSSSKEVSGSSSGRISVAEWREQRAKKSVQGWAEAAKALLSDTQRYSSKWHSKDDEAYTSIYDRTSTLLAQADSWRKQYAGNQEAIDSINSIVKALSDARTYSWKQQDFYSQWDNEEDYQSAIRAYGYQEKYKGKSYAQIQEILANMDDGEEKSWLESNKYGMVKHSSDYGDKSGSGWKKYLSDQDAEQQRAKQEKEDESFFEKLGRWLGTSPDTSLPMGTASQVSENLRNDTSYLEPRKDWSEEQKGIFGYLYDVDKDAAGQYARRTSEAMNQEENAKKTAAIEKWATRNGWNGAAATLAAIAMMPLSLADTLSALTEYNARGFVSTSAEPMPGQISNTITGAVSNVLNGHGTVAEWVPVVGGKGFGDVYQLGTSIANSLLSGYTQGSLGTYMVFFGSASASEMYAAKNRGATDSQAITLGILSGLAEAAGEAFSVEHLLGLGGAKELSGFFANVLTQAGIEASEEGVTTLLNNFADQLVMGDKSNFYALVEHYMKKEGLTESEAKRKAWLSMANDLAFDMLGGFASGGVSSGLQTGVQTMFVNRAENAQAKQIYGADPGALVTEALEINPDNAFAKKMQGRLDAGKDLSGGQLNKLVQQNEKALTAQDMSAIQGAAVQRLTELGETGDVDAIGAALAKQAAGEKLSRSESQTIAGSKYGQRVANELNAENIESGGYSSAWAETLNTQRINPKEYSRIIEAAQQPQEAAEVTGEQVIPQVPKMAQAGQAEAQTATVLENRVVADNATGKESLQVVKESLTAETEQEKPVTLEEASQKYGAQAKAMIHTYKKGQDVAKFDKAYQAAYDMGKSGVSVSYAMNSETTSYLTEGQRSLAYEAGEAAANTEAHGLDAQNKALANGKTGRKKGVVRGEGVTIADLKQTFNDTQGKAYKYLSTVAEVTGIDIVLYRSEAGPDGKFQGAQGRYRRSEPGTIYIDLNAGLSDIKNADDLAKYAMLRTFAHEFTHFIEKWNPIQYNEFRKVVFDTLSDRGENVNDLIEAKQARNPGMSYDKASREVVAEAMTDILPDSNFVQELAENHKTIFQKLLEKLQEFVENLREYFASIGHNRSREANALKEQVGDTIKYLDSIVDMFDRVAVEAVENYQQTVAEEVVVSKNENTTAVSSTSTEKVETTVETKTEEIETKPTEKPSETKQPVTETDAYGFTITDNIELGSLEISFDNKPSNEVRNVLKENKFRWHNAKKVWYGYADRQTITDALHAAYEAEVKADDDLDKVDPAAIREKLKEYGIENGQVVDEKKLENVPLGVETTPAEESYDPNDPYVRLAGLMGRRARFEHEGIVYRVLKAGPDNSMWQGRIDQADVSVGGVYVTNARGLHYTSELYENRDDARDDIIAVARASKLLDEKTTETTKPKEEVITNGTEETGAVLPHRSDGEGAPRLLAEVEAGAVPADAEAGDPVDGAGERGNETGRHDLGADAERNVGGHGEGSSQSGDLRGTDRVTESATDTNVGSKEAEKLHEEVTEQIAQQSTEKPKGRNFVIGDSLDLPNGEKARYKANVDAIRLVKKLEAEGRYATEAEQVVLSKYVGWGGIANAFSDKKAEWAKEYKELKELLTDEEYSSARGSTLNAHFTDISIIKAMYDGLKQLGFNGGRMMEPSSGVGNFVGAMPADMSAKVRSWTMVELDGITGLIAKYLYPNADMRIQGFEKANIPNDFMDVAIGNVPFGNYSIADKTYPKKVTSAIHNYFFAKSLDKVRPGGIVMFITSSYTMNSKDSTVRRYIMQKADLLGAIRLPDSAFKGNAGTEVVTDILILKKRAANTAYAGEEFLEAPWTYPVKGSYNGEYSSSYFTAHPEMVLGTPAVTTFRGGSLTYKALEGKGSLADQIRQAFQNIQGKMDYPVQKSPERTNFAVEKADKKTKQNGYVAKDGKIYQNKNGELVEVNAAKGTAERITGLLEIRDAAKELQNAQQQGLKESEIKKARQKLNKVYDTFVKQHGFINAQANRSAIKDDPDKFSIFALENWNPETKKATKADIFSKNTIAANRTVTAAKDVAEGLIVSINQTGGVDTALIAKLTGKTEADVTRELIDSRAVFKNRDGRLETAEVYLSGNVRAKLRDAEALAHMDADYQKNVEALKAVMPEDVAYQDIFVNVGAPWITNTVYSDFAAYMLGSTNREWNQAVDVTRNRETGNFTVELKNKYLKTSSHNTQKWGTSRRSFLELFDAMLNSKSVVVKYKTDDGKSVIDKDATAAANEKVENIQKEFQEWLWKDETRRTELATLYNETFNSIVTPKYNGDNLTVNGANAMKPLRPHQRDAVQRIISSGGNTLLAHKVGAGKTYEMAAAAMKLKQLGLVKKPLFAVPKPLVAQWGNEFMDFFPTAKLLVAEAGDFTAANRKIFANRIANGDYDAIIVSYEQFEKLPISADFARELYQEQIDSIIMAIEEAKAEKGGKSLSVKDLEKKRKSLQTKIDKLTDSAKDEDNIEFEQLGVDSIFVDEAHNFKNLFYTTSMNNVSGLSNKDGAKRSFDLYTKVRYLQKLNGGRGIVFATATPVMNSMSEMYIMQRYLQPDLLEQLGLSTFDAWAKQFGEVVNGVEIKPSGQGYRVKQSFSRFKNMSELQLLFRNFADVLTDVPGLKIPKMKGGKVNVVVCEPGQFQKDYMKELEKRADNIKNVDPTVDNMLKITSDGRKISYTQRMIDPSLPYEEGCKIFRCADNVVKAYKDSMTVKGTQLIFCDMATPKGKSKIADNQTEEMETDMESARLYDDIKARLMKGGIPAKEIAFIHEADTDAKKKKLFADVNEGKVRVLIGSTGKMGVGMNAQKRIVAIHHLDAPWRPGDVEQRNGRAYRQGNINDEVENFTYVTEGSFDARLWDILDRKQGFINQIMNGENVGREAEDTGEVTLSAAEVKALASGSPLIMEQVQLDTDIKKLESLRRAHRSAVSNAISRMQADKGRIAILEKMVANGKADIAATVDTYSEGKFSITIGKQKFTEKKDAGAALMAAATAKANEDGYTTIAKFAGFDLRVIKTHEGIKGIISGNQSYAFKTYPENTTYMINHLITRIGEISTAVNEWEQELANTRKDMEEQAALINQPFARQAELEQKRARFNEVMEILNPKEEQALDSMAEDDVQYQQRENWDDGDIRDDIYYPKNSRDAQAFIRSYANKTSGMKNGETRNVLVFTKDHVYFVEATGYLKGSIETVYPILGNEQLIKDAWRVFDNGTDDRGGTHSSWREVNRSRQERRSGNTSGTERSHAAGGNAGLDGQESGDSNTIGSDWENYGYNTEEEFLEAIENGVMFMDDYGNIIAKEQFQQRTDTLTDREVLTLAASQVKVSDLSDAEKSALDVFQQRLAKLEDLQAQRIEQGRLYKEQQFGAKVDRAEAAKTLNRMRTLDGQIQKASAEVLSVEEKTVLKRVLKKARTVVEEQERQHGKEILKRWRDRRNNADAIKKYRDRLRGDVDELTNWVLHPDNKNVVKHIPDALKNTVLPFLSSINFMSKRSLGGGNATVADKAFMDNLRRLAKVMENTADVDEMYANYTDLPPDFMTNLRSFMDTAQEIVDNNSGEFIINQMTAEELAKLSKVVRTLKKYIMQMNRFHVNAMFKHVYDAGENSMDFMAEMKPAENTGAVSQFLLWQQMRPAYAFERFGEGGMAVYDGLRRGQATLAFNTKKITEFSEKAYTAAEVNAWENEVKTITIGPGTVVKMRVSQIMSLYELNKREQARGHILGEGIRVATFKDGRNKISDVGHRLTLGELDKILKELTPRQKEVADNLQQFMQKQGGEWGNYVTVARFGEKQFGEENYFPINSDGRHLSVDADEKPGAASLYALLNMGFTKQTQEKAKNRIIVYSIFDVFANHMASMAQYNAFALPVVDALKWFNYQRVAIDEDGNKTLLGSVREQMDRAFGVPEESRPGSGRQGYAQNFVINILKAFNGTEAQGTPYDSFGMKMLHRYNKAQVAYNFRVVVQQPLAITRAAMFIDYKSIIKGMKLSPGIIKKNIAEMQKYSGIAAWKALGFYDVNISRGLTSLIKHNDTWIDKVDNVGMKGAELADTLTWAGIWSACKEEVIRKQKLTPKSEGFYEAVTKLFEDVIYKTQVVDSVLTKNEFMRDKGFFARSMGSFMSEPTTTASMLVDAYDKYHMDMQRGMSKQQAWKKNRNMIVRTVYVYGLGAAILAAVQAVADAFRDDDDYQEFMEKWLEAFGGNLVDELMPFNKLPLISDFYELAKELIAAGGFDIYGQMSNFVWADIAEQLIKGVEIIYGRITGEEDSYTWYGGAYKLLQAASGLTGLPMAAATREIITAWNNTVGAMAPSLKVKTYDPGDEAQIRFAYKDGYLTKKEAKEELKKKGIVETEPEAYWKVKEWDSDDGFSRYDTILDAVRNGGDFDAAMDELTSHGYKEKEVLSEVKSRIGELYKTGEISKQQATDMLAEYCDMDSDEVVKTVNKWSSKVVTGIDFNDIKGEYLDGKLTEKRAIEMYVRYGGYTQDDAAETVKKWRFEKTYGYAYSDRVDAYKKGDISASEMRNALIEFGGMTEIEADNNIRAYEWMKNNPQYDLSVSDVLSYTKPIEDLGYSVEDYGIAPDVYVEYKDEASKCKGVDANGDGRADSNTVKNQKMEIIDALPLTSEQKDALYFLNGWAKSKLRYAPWH